jgi:hypothetical protein
MIVRSFFDLSCSPRSARAARYIRRSDLALVPRASVSRRVRCIVVPDQLFDYSRRSKPPRSDESAQLGLSKALVTDSGWPTPASMRDARAEGVRSACTEDQWLYRCRTCRRCRCAVGPLPRRVNLRPNQETSIPNARAAHRCLRPTLYTLARAGACRNVRTSRRLPAAGCVRVRRLSEEDRRTFHLKLEKVDRDQV